MNMSNKKVIIKRIVKSIIANAGIFIGIIIELIPKIQKILKILLPTTFPTAKSTSFFNAAIIEVTSSGSEVPTATIVKDIKYILSSSFPLIKKE